MQENLYTSSLITGEVKPTKSYDIHYLFYVAFFGGIIAVSVLGIKNAKWLQIDKKLVRVLILISSLLFMLKLVLFYAFTHQIIDLHSSYLKYSANLFGIICFLAYYFILKNPYKEHILIHGETEPLLKEGILWALAAALIEGILFVLMAIL